jgi:hypothetical protein
MVRALWRGFKPSGAASATIDGQAGGTHVYPCIGFLPVPLNTALNTSINRWCEFHDYAQLARLVTGTIAHVKTIAKSIWRTTCSLVKKWGPQNRLDPDPTELLVKK